MTWWKDMAHVVPQQACLLLEEQQACLLLVAVLACLKVVQELPDLRNVRHHTRFQVQVQVQTVC